MTKRDSGVELIPLQTSSEAGFTHLFEAISKRFPIADSLCRMTDGTTRAETLKKSYIVANRNRSDLVLFHNKQVISTPKMRRLIKKRGYEVGNPFDLFALALEISPESEIFENRIIVLGIDMKQVGGKRVYPVLVQESPGIGITAMTSRPVLAFAPEQLWPAGSTFLCRKPSQK